jgi:hypothetical protein
MTSRTLGSFMHVGLDGYDCDSSSAMGFAQKPPGDEAWNGFGADGRLWEMGCGCLV